MRSRRSAVGRWAGSYKRYLPRSTIIRDNYFTSENMFVKLTFGFTQFAYSTAGGTDYLIFRGNSAYLPVVGGSGQPLGFDQWSAMYNMYTVVASSIEANYAGAYASNGATYPAVVLFPTLDQGDVTTSTPVSTMIQYPHAVHKEQLLVGKHPIHLDSCISSSAMFGVPKKNILTDDVYSAVVTAHPANVWYWVLSMTPADLITTTDLSIYVKVIYHIRFSLRVNPANS